MFKGVQCTVILAPEDLPESGACPYCDGPVQKFPALMEQIQGVENGIYDWPAYKRDPQPATWRPHARTNYVKMWMWQIEQKRCFKHPMHLKNSFKKHTGIDVDIEP